MSNAPSPAKSDGGADALQALALREARTAARVSHLESIIADASLGIVKRTKARVELALITGDDHDGGHQSRLEEEIAKIKGNVDVSKNRQRVEKDVKSERERLAHERAIREHQADLHERAVKRREEARRRVEEARVRAKEAEAELIRAEMEAECAANTKDAEMARERMRVARERAEDERRLLEEAKVAEEKEARMAEEKEEELTTKMEEMEMQKTPQDFVTHDEANQERDEVAGGSGEASEVQPLPDSDIRDDHKDMIVKAATMKDGNDQVAEEEFERLDTLDTESSSETDDVADGAKADEDGDKDAVEVGDEHNEGINDEVEKEETVEVFDEDDDIEDKKEEVVPVETELDAANVKIAQEEEEVIGEEEQVMGEEEREHMYYSHVVSLEDTIKELHAIIKRQAEKIDSLETHIEETGEAQAYWQEQSAKLSDELSDMQQLKEVQEKELQLLKERVETDDDRIDNLRSEVDDLRGMKAVLEWKLSTAKESERSALQSLKEEIDKLLDQRESALEAAESMREMYESSIRQHEAAIEELRMDVDLRGEELDRTRALLDERDDQLQSMQDTGEKTDEEQGDGNGMVMIAQLTSDLEGHKSRIAELEQANEVQGFALSNMKKRLAQKDTEIRSMSSLLAEHDEQKHKEEEQKETIAELSIELQRHRDQLAMFQQINELLKKKMLENDSEIQMLSEMLSEEKVKAEKQLAEANELQGFIVGNLNRKISQKDSEIQKLQSLLESEAEQGDEIQTFVIASQKKKMSQFQSKMQELSSSLSAAKEKEKMKSDEAAHFKEYAVALEQRRNELEDALDATQRKLSKKIFHLQKEVSQLEKKASNEPRRFSSSKTIASSEDGFSVPSALLSPGSIVSASSAEDTTYTAASWEAKVEKNALEQLLWRVLAERDQLAAENEELKHTIEQSDGTKAGGTTVGEYLSLARDREIAALEKRLVDLMAEKKILESWRSVADAVESNDDTSREECLVMMQAIDEEHAEVEEKLKLLMQDKENVGSGDNSGHGHSGHGKSVSFNEKEEVKSKPKRAQVYQLTCRECNDDLNYIGKTRRDLKKQVKRHFDDVWSIVEKEKGDDSQVERSQTQDEDFAKTPFAKHFVRHCRNAQSYEEVMRWCSSNIKVQRQKIEDWEQLEEDDELTRTVYQLSCRCCSHHHYIGSTHEDLKKKIVKHYGDVWQMVKKEYGDGGFCKDTEDYGCKMGKFGASANHFAKHCRHAKSIEDVDAWCEKNVKVEKWVMVCRKCLGTAVDTNLNTKNSSIMSFKVEHKVGS